MEGLWNKLSGSESAAIVDNMTTGVRILLLLLFFSPSLVLVLQRHPNAVLFSCGTGRLGFQVPGSDAYATAVWLRDLVSRASLCFSLPTSGGRHAWGRSTEPLNPPVYTLFYSLVCGFALSLIGAICFVLGQITLFATLYTLGVVCSLVGTGFLLGFWKQCKMMMDPVRIYAAGE